MGGTAKPVGGHNVVMLFLLIVGVRGGSECPCAVVWHQGEPMATGQDDELCRRITTLLTSPDVRERVYAAEYLCDRKDRASVPYLIQALHDPDPIVRGWVAHALGEIGDPAAIVPLIDAAERTEANPAAFKESRDFKGLRTMYVAL